MKQTIVQFQASSFKPQAMYKVGEFIQVKITK